MKNQTLAIVALSAFIALGAGCAYNQPTSHTAVPERGWIVAARPLPVPVDASEELIASLSEIPAPDVAASDMKAPKTDEEWIESVAAVDQFIGKLTTDLAAMRSVTISADAIDGVNVHWVTPASIAPTNTKRLFLFTHGGAYTSGAGVSGLLEAVAIADGAKIKVLSVDYRMPPAHPFPVGLNEVVSVYRHVLTKYAPETVAFGGTSAGGGLALAAVHRFIQLKLPVPGALFAGTPWSDLTKTGDSYFTNAGVDRILVSYDGRLRAAAALYAGDTDLKNPLISPVYGDFTLFPPTYLVSGTRDLFLSNTIRVHRKLRRAGVVADLNVYEGISHGEFFAMPDLPEAKEIYTALGAFILQHLK